MQTLKSFLDQTLLIWKDSTAAARFGIALLMLICVGAVVGVGIWSAQPNYVVLASDLQPEKAGKIINALDAADIAYQVKGSGSIILVDSRKWSRAKIAAGKLGISHAGTDMEDVTPWMDPLNQQNIFRRNLERQLEDSIRRFKSIESAEVHLSVPEKQAFIRQRNAPSAAVMLELANGSQFGEAQASAIASLVANSVAGLTTDHVSITDSAGNEYATDASMGRLSKQEEYRMTRERELSQKAERILTRFLGLGNASVAVTTDFTFPEGTTTITEFDPEKKVVVDETIKSSTTTGEDAVAAGTAGTASNIGSANTTSSAGKKSVLSKTEDLNSKYEVSKTLRTESVNTPVLNFMTVSALVNSTSVMDESQTIPPQIKTQVEALIAQAVGLREGKDQITVEFFEFVDPLPLTEPVGAPMPWDKINNILKNISLGVAAVVALLIAMKVLKKIQPDPAPATEIADRASQVDQLSELVKQNPEVFSRIIASWSNADGDADEEQEKRAA